MKYAILGYENSNNFGDEIQSIAASQLLPRVDTIIPRERLRTFHLDESHILIMNGYFNPLPNEFPPSPNIIPLYISFHIASHAEKFYTSPQCIEHFQKNAPIGCRDKKTMKILSEKGVDTYYSKCLTLTFPTRKIFPKEEKIICVDSRVSKKYPESVFKNTNNALYFLSHGHSMDFLGDDIKMSVANKIINLYETQATLIVTTRLHAALPSIAMGIPVLYFGTFDERTSILEDIGVQAHKKISYKSIGWLGRKLNAPRFRNYNWKSPIINIEQEKSNIINLFNKQMLRLQK